MESRGLARTLWGLVAGTVLVTRGLVGLEAQAGELQLSWVDNSGGQASFSVERKAADGAYQPVATLAPGVAAYLDASVVAGAVYCYRVQAYNAAGASGYSNEACGAVAQGLDVAVAVVGSGTVTSSPAGIVCGTDCTESYASGAVVTLTATPAVGAVFTGWSGGGCSGTEPCAVTGNGPLTVTATFAATDALPKAPGTYTLTVSADGAGTVTSSPGGITCSPTCSAAFASGTPVTLTASPTQGSVFAGWSGGGCGGTGACTVTLSADTAVTATFSAAASTLFASVLPSSRSVQVGTPATAFATLINAGASPALDCALAPTTSLPAAFSFQATDPATNQLTGSPNTPVTIAPQAAQSFVFALTPSSTLAPTDVGFTFDCSNTAPAATVVGVNTLLLSASATAVPDIVALAATPNNDGIVTLPGATGTGVFAVATVNVGAGGPITVSADTAGAPLPVQVTLCETNAATGQCVGVPAPGVTVTMSADGTSTFGIFVRGMGSSIPFDPAGNRIFVRLKDAGGVTRGATSVAVRTP